MPEKACSLVGWGQRHDGGEMRGAVAGDMKRGQQAGRGEVGITHDGVMGVGRWVWGCWRGVT